MLLLVGIAACAETVVWLRYVGARAASRWQSVENFSKSRERRPQGGLIGAAARGYRPRESWKKSCSGRRVVEIFPSGPSYLAHPATAASPSHSLSSPVRMLLRCIRRRTTEPLTLRELATALGRQAEYLGWLFRHETGTTFHDRLTTIRLRRAARLIRTGEKIDAVTLLVGYRSKKNFYHQFRRRFGVTPGEYRDRTRTGRATQASSG